jgi:anaerobic magnesium-protoporphyrin IX monomethyl ester cyclase
MIDAMISKREHRAGGAIYSLLSYLKEKNEYSSEIDTKIFNFNSVYTGPVNLYISAINEWAPDLVAFSTYCWNIDLVTNISKMIHKLNPNTKIVLGGPEVSYNSDELLEQNDQVDVIIRGEGEVIFNHLVTCLFLKQNLAQVPGITYRNRQNEIIHNEDSLLHDCLDDFPSPFLSGTIDLAKSDGEVAYESVRGCKFRCSYCLHTKGLSFVRTYSLERIEAELKQILVSNDVKIIWFLDPTFNADEEHAMRILKIVETYNPNMPLAFEIRADLLTDQLIAQFGRVHVAEVGIGLQSSSEESNQHVHRKNNILDVEVKLKKLKAAIGETCEQFDIDLIYGLPGDVYENYKRSVDYVLYLGGRIYYQPLRVFKGTQLFNDVDKYGIVYNEKSPYNTLCNSSFHLTDMISAYCLNVGVDYINLNQIYREIITDLKESRNLNYSDVLEQIGRFFWSRQRYDLFRISNWSPDDRAANMLADDFHGFLVAYFEENQNPLLAKQIFTKLDDFKAKAKCIDEQSLQSSFFQLTI